MIQFNLLPDVKVDYMKASRTRRIVMLASMSLTALALFVFVLLFLIVNVFQKQHINNLNGDITSYTKELKDIPDLDKVLTVQNQLSELTALHEQKPVSSRLYGYLVQLTPQQAKISSVKIDFADSSIELSGSASSLDVVNKYADIMKFTTYKEGDSETKTNAFTDVVLNSFGIGENSAQDKGRATYTIQAKFDPAIFEGTKTVVLETPNTISTRSVTEKPSDLFEAPSKNTNGM